MPMDLKETKKEIIKKPENVSGWKNRHFFHSLGFAILGLVTAYREERNVRFHVASIILVAVLGWWFHLITMEWLWLTSAIFAVLSSEIWNSALENVVDLTTGMERHPLAKKAKDMAAGAVLLAAIYAMIVGAIIFVPHLWQLLSL